MLIECSGYNDHRIAVNVNKIDVITDLGETDDDGFNTIIYIGEFIFKVKDTYDEIISSIQTPASTNITSIATDLLFGGTNESS